MITARSLSAASDSALGDLLSAMRDVARYAEPGEALAALTDLEAVRDEIHRRDLSRSVSHLPFSDDDEAYLVGIFGPRRSTSSPAA